jgi:hypothetical protein
MPFQGMMMGTDIALLAGRILRRTATQQTQHKGG